MARIPFENIEEIRFAEAVDQINEYFRGNVSVEDARLAARDVLYAIERVAKHRGEGKEDET